MICASSEPGTKRENMTTRSTTKLPHAVAADGRPSPAFSSLSEQFHTQLVSPLIYGSAILIAWNRGPGGSLNSIRGARVRLRSPAKVVGCSRSNGDRRRSRVSLAAKNLIRCPGSAIMASHDRALGGTFKKQGPSPSCCRGPLPSPSLSLHY